MEQLAIQERAALVQIMTWGTDPAIEADVERLERLHEAALAERPEDESAYREGGGCLVPPPMLLCTRCGLDLHDGCACYEVEA